MPTRCRQARHRFTRAVGQAVAVAGGQPLRLAYADPPYPGKAWLYRRHRDYAGEVDHAALIRRLSTYDGWALSTSAAALPAVLPLCPPGVRVAEWHRGERPAPARWPLNAWEPVIYSGGRLADPSSPDPSRLQARQVDSLVHGVSAMTTLPGRVIGAKRELRHSFVSLLSDADVPVEKISRLVGHTDTTVTETVYRHQLRPMLTEGAGAMDDIFKER